jgi:hypothetical protein
MRDVANVFARGDIVPVATDVTADHFVDLARIEDGR